ncbi:MAG: hypothetical protein ACYS0G_07685 [Planctomycetota bacterium]
MRLFLYNYAVDGNWEVTRDRRVFGASDDGAGTGEKAFRDLDIGDVVVIRDSTFNWSECRIFGACVIAGEMVLQRRDKSLCEDLLWCDERSKHDIVYPYRWPVEIEGAPLVGRKRFPWEDLDRVGAIGAHGQLLEGRAAWQMKFRGNLIVSPREVRALSRIFDLRMSAERGP